MKIIRPHNESIGTTIKRFRRHLERSGTMQEILSRTFYTKPSEKRRKKKVRKEELSRMTEEEKQKNLKYYLRHRD